MRAVVGQVEVCLVRDFTGAENDYLTHLFSSLRLKIFLRQLSSINLAIRILREHSLTMKDRRDHVAGNDLASDLDGCARRRTPRRGHDRDDTAQPVSAGVQGGSLGDIVQTVEGGLNFFQLDAIPHVLNLIVLAPLNV